MLQIAVSAMVSEERNELCFFSIDTSKVVYYRGME